MLPRVIAVSGYKRCGKDTIAEYLVRNYGYKNVKIAETLKRVCQIVFGLNDEQLDGSKKEEIDERWGIAPRKIMQFIGTEVMQYQIQQLLPGIGRTFWIRSLITKYSNTNEPIVISDLRFKHEYEELRKAFGSRAYFFQVKKALNDKDLDEHSSETEWMNIPYDFQLSNNGTIEDLYIQVDECMKMIKTNS